MNGNIYFEITNEIIFCLIRKQNLCIYKLQLFRSSFINDLNCVIFFLFGSIFSIYINSAYFTIKVFYNQRNIDYVMKIENNNKKN